ncbi:MAG: cysteine desulfurase [Rhodocyclaceae bacterium]|nr:cysteine desulfurase [Rhodocyclaceae bacterium]
MTTPTATAERQSAQHAAEAQAALPPGLPDALDLARLAGEFFAALPGAPSRPPLDPQTLQAVGPADAALAAAPRAAAAPVAAPRGMQPGVQGLGAPANLPAAAGAAYPAAGASLPAADPLDLLAGLALAPPHGPRPSGPAPAVPAVPEQQDLLRLLSELDDGTRAAALPAAVPGFALPAFYFVDAGSQRGAGAEFAPPRNFGAVPGVPGAAHPPFDVETIRRDFPILSERVHGDKPLVWFDNAATTHKPRAVIDRLAQFYAHENSNIHRAAHALAARATDAYEAARDKVAAFLGAGSGEHIVFVRGATEAINLVAQSWGRQNLGEGDEIVVSLLEHHANIVPWQQIAQRTGARIRVIPVDDSGQIMLDEASRLITGRTRLVAITQVSNALGSVTPVREIVAMGHRAGARVLVDGAQSVAHMRVDVRALDADFFVFSGHKIFGPTGIGVLYGKPELLASMPPWQGGGNMIADVKFDQTTYQPAPAKFEAGTGNIADAVGLGAALDYVRNIGLENIARYEHELLAYATAGLRGVPGLRLIGTAADKASVASFVLEGYRTEEVGAALDREGIAVRSGHHCAQPILRRFGVESTVRPALAFYNTCTEVDLLITTLHRLAQGAPRGSGR